MKSTIVYIHGYGSSPASDTAVKFKNEFKDEHFLCPHINHDLDPYTTKKQFIDAFADKLKNHDDVVVIGSSMGGFWADYMAVTHGFKAVLINPALKPSVTMKRFDAPDKYIKHYAEIEDFIKPHSRHFIVTFYGSDDEIIPIDHIHQHYKNPIILKGETHRISNMKPVFDMVKKMIGNYPEKQ